VHTVDCVLGPGATLREASQPPACESRRARHLATSPSEGCDYLGKGTAGQQIPLQSTRIISILRYALEDHGWQ